MRGAKRPIYAVAAWVRRQPPKVKAFLCVVTGMAALVFLRFIVHDHDNLFVASEAVHALGISVLIYKLTKERTCAGACRPHFPFSCSIVEPFTAHYVFALGVARFLSCAHWVLQVVGLVLDTRGRLLTALGYGLWPSMVLLAEIVQTFILADFCYYYVKSLVGGQLVLRLPSGVV
ncbi:hypothetical protein BHE74_00041391 [Ensete ventricosum]|nr:hypothetical protein GW17_00018136 [Ensete ventricosum]RWW52198.1 hypothetical protein BHE74_00041391 [Ensete ventricosum]RZS07931.1 hypothetical protein BHM03_00038852 [Ensete ventricosum]